MENFECDLYMDLMPLVKDGAASEASRQALQEHMKVCASCAQSYRTLPETDIVPENGEKILKMIRRRWFIGAMLVVILGTLVGVSITSFRGLTAFNIILMPVVGVAAYIALRGRAWWIVPSVFAVSLAGLLLRYVWADGESLRLALSAAGAMAFCYAMGCAAGVGIGALASYAFGTLECPGLLNRVKRIAMALAIFAAVAAPVYGIHVFLGNPIIAEAANGDARYYVDYAYPGNDFVLGDAQYRMKRTGYVVQVQSASSPDTNFSIYYNRMGIRTGDNYDEYVKTRRSTAARLEAQYARQVEQAMEGASFPVFNCYVSLFDDPEEIAKQLELDGQYDINAWASETGCIIMVCRPEEATKERAAQILLEIRQLLDEAGVRVNSVTVSVVDKNGTVFQMDPVAYDMITQELRKGKNTARPGGVFIDAEILRIPMG